MGNKGGISIKSLVFGIHLSLYVGDGCHLEAPKK
jgi:hypothetical protein